MGQRIDRCLPLWYDDHGSHKLHSHLELLRGRVQIPTGGIAREPCASTADPVQFRGRQYSLDERRALKIRRIAIFPPLKSESLQGHAYFEGGFAMTKTNRRNLPVQYLTRIAVLAAVASVLYMIEIPVIAFYKLDLSNLPVLLGAFSMGPVPGILILLVKSLLGLLHSSSGGVGELADFIMGTAYILPAALIYRHHKSRNAALFGMTMGTLCMIVVSVLVNWKIMIPFYMNVFGMPMEDVIGMASKALPFVDTEWKLLLCVTAPFNLLKGVVLSLLTFLLYKRLSPLLHVQRSRA